jgi:hypothetical protein
MGGHDPIKEADVDSEGNLEQNAPTADEDTSATNGDISTMGESLTGEPKTKRGRRKLIVLGAAVALFAVIGGGVGIWHGQPSFCATLCHDTMGRYYESYMESDFLVHAHADAGVVCLDCHEPTIAQQLEEAQIQISGEYRLPLKKMDVEDEFCMREGCHSRETVIANTSGYIGVDGTSVNPHEITLKAGYTDTESPHQPGGEAIACANCHTAHRESVGIDYCYSCHHAETFKTCYSCHDHR